MPAVPATGVERLEFVMGYNGDALVLEEPVRDALAEAVGVTAFGNGAKPPLVLEVPFAVPVRDPKPGSGALVLVVLTTGPGATGMGGA